MGRAVIFATKTTDVTVPQVIAKDKYDIGCCVACPGGKWHDQCQGEENCPREIR